MSDTDDTPLADHLIVVAATLVYGYFLLASPSTSTFSTAVVSLLYPHVPHQ